MLDPPDHTRLHKNKARESRLPRTGSWNLQNAALQAWMEDKYPVLSLSDKQGANPGSVLPIGCVKYLLHFKAVPGKESLCTR